jgi:transcriptional regulator with XRE-family HTH domain
MRSVSDELTATITLLRKSRGLSAAQLAEACKAAGGAPISMHTIFNIESRRRRDITVDELAVFATVFDLPPGDLLTGQFCATCSGSPPARFTCNTCGRTGSEEEEPQ